MGAQLELHMSHISLFHRTCAACHGARSISYIYYHCRVKKKTIADSVQNVGTIFSRIPGTTWVEKTLAHSFEPRFKSRGPTETDPTHYPL